MHEVDIDFSHDRFLCPLTGEVLLDMDGPMEGSPPPTLAFLFCHSSDTLVAHSDAARDAWAKAEARVEKDPDTSMWEAFVKALSRQQRWVSFNLTTFHMACGPVWYTTSVGVDMGASLDG